MKRFNFRCKKNDKNERTIGYLKIESQNGLYCEFSSIRRFFLKFLTNIENIFVEGQNVLPFEINNIKNDIINLKKELNGGK